MYPRTSVDTVPRRIAMPNHITTDNVWILLSKQYRQFQIYLSIVASQMSVCILNRSSNASWFYLRASKLNCTHLCYNLHNSVWIYVTYLDQYSEWVLLKYDLLKSSQARLERTNKFSQQTYFEIAKTLFQIMYKSYRCWGLFKISKYLRFFLVTYLM